MKHRFEKTTQSVTQSVYFVPSRFSELVKNFKTAHDLQTCVNTFCETYNMDAFRCADELFNFARSFKKFDHTIVSNSDEDNQEEDDSDNDKLSSTQFSRGAAVMTTKMKLKRSGKFHPQCGALRWIPKNHRKINITEFYKQEQCAIHTVLFKTKASNSPLLYVTFINKLTFNRILKKEFAIFD